MKSHALNHKSFFLLKLNFITIFKGVNSYHYMYFYAYQYFCLQKQLQIPEAMEMVQ